jgi:hypothetical protein
MRHSGLESAVRRRFPELIQTMRAALDEVMAKIPVDEATPGIKAHMAEFILKAALASRNRRTLSLPLRNVAANYPFERSRRFPGSSRVGASETIRVRAAPRGYTARA